MTDTPSAVCTPMTLFVGREICLDRECDQYMTDGGEDTGINVCSHLRQEQACETHSVEVDAGRYDPAAPWPCPHIVRDTAQEG
ncbi:hypothetical protein [Kitasatospora indigofera]|uniref:hypothetical protein n=1 Tax=Kitasatospora indigofera TaxID=67307 RepID=UPI00367E424A